MAAVKNRRERLIKERISLEESKRVAQERLDRLESFICANLGGQGWKIKVDWLKIQYETAAALCDTSNSWNTVINRENQVTADEKVQVVSLDGEEVDLNDLLSAA